MPEPEVVSLTKREHAFYKAGIAQGEANALREMGAKLKTAADNYAKQIATLPFVKRVKMGTGWIAILEQLAANLATEGEKKSSEATGNMSKAIAIQAPKAGMQARFRGAVKHWLEQ